MQSPTWHLDYPCARFELDRLSATVDLSRPEHGLTGLRADGNELPGAELLGLACPAAHGGEANEPLECYQRGPDLIAAYGESPGWPIRVDALWRAAAAATAPVQAAGVLALVDLVVSVRTELPDSWPELAVRSAIPAAEFLRLAGAESARFEPYRDILAGPLVLEAEGGPGSLLARLPGVALSYAEMVHPADFRRSELRRHGASASAIEVRHGLFAERLEKGVILRARVRGILMDRPGDARQAAACYAAFAAAEPPLGA
jgi:hypothetical protein